MTENSMKKDDRREDANLMALRSASRLSRFIEFQWVVPLCLVSFHTHS